MMVPLEIPKASLSERREPSAKRVRIVERAASILECFSHATPELSLTQVCSRLAIPKPTAFRILTVLVRNGLLEHNPSSNIYMLGFATLRYAESLIQSLDIREPARAAMQRIRDEVNETVVLSVREGDDRFNVDSVQSTHAISQAQQVGVPIPLYAGAASRVLLAAMPDDDIRGYLARVRPVAFSKTTITNPAQLLKEVAQIRRRGYAISNSEYTAGGCAVACAITDANGFGQAALHFSIPPARYSVTLEKQLVRRLRDGINAISGSGRR